jgi:hypothetical protein
MCDAERILHRKLVDLSDVQLADLAKIQDQVREHVRRIQSAINMPAMLTLSEAHQRIRPAHLRVVGDDEETAH